VTDVGAVTVTVGVGVTVAVGADDGVLVGVGGRPVDVGDVTVPSDELELHAAAVITAAHPRSMAIREFTPRTLRRSSTIPGQALACSASSSAGSAR
jgi:hypothetical protein